MAEADEDVLKRRIREAFPIEQPPPKGDITANDCSFCIHLSDSFAGRQWETLDPTVVDRHSGDIALLSPEAFVYYLPAFLCRAVDHPIDTGIGSSQVLHFTIESLCDEELPADAWWAARASKLSAAQNGVVKMFLEWVTQRLLGDEDEDDLRASAEQALSKYWSAA